MSAGTFDMILSKIEKRIKKKYTFSRSYFSEGKIGCMPKVSNTFFIVIIRSLLVDYISQSKKLKIADYNILIY